MTSATSAPLQLEGHPGALRLWTRPGDTVFSPFGGIGSEGTALEMGRRSVSVELKRVYYEQAARNLASVDDGPAQQALF